MTEGRQTPFEKALANSKAVVEGAKREPSDIQEAMQNVQTEAMSWLAKRTR